MHFFHPVVVMQLVELVAGLRTSEETLNRTSHFAQGFFSFLLQLRPKPTVFIFHVSFQPWERLSLVHVTLLDSSLIEF